MRVAHTFEVVKQANVAAIVCLGDVYPVCHHCVNGRPNPKPHPNLHLWVGVRVVILHLVTSTTLSLGCGVLPDAWGVAAR